MKVKLDCLLDISSKLGWRHLPGDGVAIDLAVGVAVGVLANPGVLCISRGPGVEGAIKEAIVR